MERCCQGHQFCHSLICLIEITQPRKICDFWLYRVPRNRNQLWLSPGWRLVGKQFGFAVKLPFVFSWHDWTSQDMQQRLGNYDKISSAFGRGTEDIPFTTDGSCPEAKCCLQVARSKVAFCQPLVVILCPPKPPPNQKMIFKWHLT